MSPSDSGDDKLDRFPDLGACNDALDTGAIIGLFEAVSKPHWL
jgi:hypothetical protein